jgi:hypothetical protein
LGAPQDHLGQIGQVGGDDRGARLGQPDRLTSQAAGDIEGLAGRAHAAHGLDRQQVQVVGALTGNVGAMSTDCLDQNIAIPIQFSILHELPLTP